LLVYYAQFRKPKQKVIVFSLYIMYDVYTIGKTPSFF